MSNQTENGRRERRGYLILAVLALSALLIFNLDVIVDWTRGYVDIVAVVGETSGIRKGSSVWVGGVEAGRVRDLAFIGQGDSSAVAVDVRLEDRALALVRHGSDVYTTKRRFIGEPIVRIEAGDPAAPPVEDGDTLRGGSRASLDELIRRGKVFPSALDSLTDTLERLQGLVEGRRPDLATLAERLAAATDEATRLSRRLEGGTVDRLMADPRLGERITGLRHRLADLGAAVDSAGRRAGDAGLGTRLDSLDRRRQRLAAELAVLQDRLDTGSGTLGRMRRDSALAVAMGGVRAQIDSLMAEALTLATRMLLP